MKEMALIVYGFACAVLPALLLYFALHVVYQARGIREPRFRLLMILIFSVYVAGVFYVTGTGTIYNIHQYGLSAMVLETNLIPFSDKSIDAVGYLLNVVLLLPLGFLLPMLWPKQNKLWKILFSGAAVSLLIELSQLLNIRSSDIDDLLLNTLGAVIGFMLYRAFSWLIKREDRIETGFRVEAVLYIAVMFLGRFLLYYEIGFAKILYGF